MKTQQERRNQIIRYSILFAISAFVVLMIVDPGLRESALEKLEIAQQLKNVQGVGSGVALAVVAFFLLIENLEKLHFIWEMGHKLLGINLEELAQKQSEFVELPADYVQRPELERTLRKALTIGPKPKLVVIDGPKDAGKTTLLHYLSQRYLNRAFKAHTITARGDLESIERRPDENENRAKQRLVVRILRRIIKQASIPGDVGDTLPMMQRAIREYFESEPETWLIIIDQIDDPAFLFNEILPYIYGTNNVVIVSGTAINIPDKAFTFVTKEEERQKIAPQHITITTFTGTEAMQMFSQEVRKRKRHILRDDKDELSKQLADTLPGDIQRLSDIYVSGGGLTRIKDIRRQQPGILQSRAVAESLYNGLHANERAFFVLFDFFVGDSTDREVLAFAARELCHETSFDQLLKTSLDRHYLQVLKEKNSNRLAKARNNERYTITKLGRAIAGAIELCAERDVVLNAGAAILDFYRMIDVDATSIDLRQELPNILGMMSWAQQIERLRDDDLIYFSHTLRRIFYRGTNWDLGLNWLKQAEIAASDGNLHRKLSDLSTAHARILLASGKINSAQAMLDNAIEANQQSKVAVQEDRHLGIFLPEQLKEEEYYDDLQQYWIAHLHFTAQRLIMDITGQASQFDRLLADIEPFLARLNAHKDAKQLHLRTREIATELLLDKANILMAQGDYYYQQKNTAKARACWDNSRQALTVARREAELVQAKEILAQAWRGEVKYSQRSIMQHNTLINRWAQYRQGIHAAVKSLESAKKGSSFFEEALTYYENCRLILHTIERVPEAKGSISGHSRLIILSSRWRRLNSIHKQLLTAYATMASYGSMAHQILILHALVDASQQLYRLSGDPVFKKEAEGFEASIQTISQRLQNEIPERMPVAEPVAL